MSLIEIYFETILCSTVLEILSDAIRQVEIKDKIIGKEESKLLLFADHMIIYF